MPRERKRLLTCPTCGKTFDKVLACNGHMAEHSRHRPSAVERFWSKVDTRAVGGCWLWLDASVNGYGALRVGGRKVKAHRFAYELLVGPIPDGLTIDHLCMVQMCVNPAHLEAVTNRENIIRSPFTTPGIHIRQTHCIHGHAFDSENTLIGSRGQRVCRACRRLNQPRYKATYKARLAERKAAAA